MDSKKPPQDVPSPESADPAGTTAPPLHAPHRTAPPPPAPPRAPPPMELPAHDPIDVAQSADEHIELEAGRVQAPGVAAGRAGGRGASGSGISGSEGVGVHDADVHYEREPSVDASGQDGDGGGYDSDDEPLISHGAEHSHGKAHAGSQSAGDFHVAFAPSAGEHSGSPRSIRPRKSSLKNIRDRTLSESSSHASHIRFSDGEEEEYNDKAKSDIERKESQVKFAIGLDEDDFGASHDDWREYDKAGGGAGAVDMTRHTGQEVAAVNLGRELAGETDVDAMEPRKQHASFSDLPPSKDLTRKKSLADFLSRPSLTTKVYDSGNNQMLVELDELQPATDIWQEKARWIKYEETFEAGSNRWGKPHVASLGFHSLTQLRECIDNGLVLLDVEEMETEEIWQHVIGELIKANQLPKEDAEKLKELLLRKHTHVNYRTLTEKLRRRSSTVPPHLPRRRSEPQVGVSVADRLHDLNEEYKRENNNDQSKDATDTNNMTNGKNNSHPVAFDNKAYKIESEDIEAQQGSRGIQRSRSNASQHSQHSQHSHHSATSNTSGHHRVDIYKYLADTAEACNILVGRVDFLQKPITAFIRLDMAANLGDLTEGQIPTRFLFLSLGPTFDELDYYEMGRSFGALMATLDFQQLAWECMSKKTLLNGIHHFLDDSLVLPAGDWDEELLKPVIQAAHKKAVEVRRKSLHPAALASVIAQMNIDPYGDPLERTGKPFGGMINDIKRRYPLYLSDIKDGLNAQCFATFFFLFFACLAPAITFGGLLSDKVDKWIGVSELLLATAVIGVVNGLLSAQPIKVIGFTGPMLLFEEAFYQMCDALDIEYISAHVWVGVWIFIISVIVVGCDGSVLVRLISRFTEEIFSALISLLFIYETFYKLYLVFQKHPLQSNYSPDEVFVNDTGNYTLVNGNNTEPSEINNEPNTALLTLILTMCTFGLAYYLRFFRNGHYLGRTARRALGDFGIPIAILVMVLIDFGIHDTYTEKLDVPDGFQPTDAEKRGWIINPMGVATSLPVWVCFGAIVPAILAFILIFMETQIVGVIVNKPERHLQKGSGFHLDILLIGVFCLMSGFIGFPMMGVAAVRSITHINALSVYSKTHAPGEKPRLVHVHEQRVTVVLVHLVMGFTTLMGPLLRTIPLAVLFGVFLYMGVASMSGVQLFDRIEMFFMPVKHHPNEPYVKNVRTWKMHVFTIIQILCLGILWAVKSTQAALGFPFVLILMIPIRRYLLPFAFTRSELHYLDQTGALPVDDDDSEPSEMGDPDFYTESKMSNIRRRRSTQIHMPNQEEAKHEQNSQSELEEKCNGEQNEKKDT